jgi:arginine decarboxylase
MKTKYVDLIDQSFDFPQEEFTLNTSELNFHGIDLMALIEEHGAPLKFTYLPKISDNINRAKGWFADAIKEHNYAGNYNYCYCTKSSHFKHVLDEALKNDIHIETSSAFDVDIVENLKAQGKITDNTYVISNGFKRDQYVQNLARLINNGHKNCIVVLDNYEEINLFDQVVDGNYNVGIRIASEEEPKFEFYTSRLGIGYKNIVPFYNREIKGNPKVTLKMLHFFINTGIRDTAYYWNELLKCMKVYVNLKKECPTLDSLNIGGGFPIKNSLAYDYDYAYMVSEIIRQIKQVCEENDVAVPHVFMINSSFITTLPDSWAINKRFIMLPINRWDKEYERVLLGGLTCDSDDYYNSEQHMNAIYLPKYNQEKPLYIGFFNTGAYQETIGGFGGLQHCLIPTPKHILIDRDDHGKLVTSVFAEQQTSEQLLSILGYDYGVNNAFAKANNSNSEVSEIIKLSY